MRPQLFGTLFYANYLTRALALYHSMERCFHGEFTLVMLCMDDAALEIISRLRLPKVRAISVDELERFDPALKAVKPLRSIGEYCWTCTPSFLRFLIEGLGPGAAAVYLDADLMFFADPQAIFDEWKENDLLIHEHRYAGDHRHMAETSGIFNVGMLGIRKSKQGYQCLERWRTQCIQACALDGSQGLCGDQKYLDEWPNRYDRLTIFQHKGGGLAPWNIEQYELTTTESGPLVDGVPVIFYHYHALRILSKSFFGRVLVLPSAGYDFTRTQLRLLYRPYLRALKASFHEVCAVEGAKLLPSARASLAEIRAYRRRIIVS